VASKYKTSVELESDEIEQEGEPVVAEDQLVDFITNQPVKDSAVERVLQAVARSLVDEYGFDHTQLDRDQRMMYETYDDQGRTVRVRTKLDIVVYPEDARKDNYDQVIRVCLVQPPNTKATDAKKGVALLENVDVRNDIGGQVIHAFEKRAHADKLEDEAQRILFDALGLPETF
jgi:hypothetical protein